MRKLPKLLRKALVPLVQLLITAGILAFVFREEKQRAEIAAALRMADVKWLLRGLLVYGCVELLASVRWKILLAIQGLDRGWLHATRLLMISVFFNLFTPGLIGGDAVRLFYLTREMPECGASPAFAAVMMDRIIGLLSLLFLAAVLTLARYQWLSQTVMTKRLVEVTLMTLGISFAVFVLTLLLGVSGWIRKLPFSEKLLSIVETWRRFRHRWKFCLLAFFITLAAHCAFYATFFCAAQAFHATTAGATPSLGEIFAIMPIVNTLTSVPISFAGIGVREALFQTLLGNLVGTPAGVAALMASTGFLMRVFWGMTGGVMFLFHPLPRSVLFKKE